MSYAHKSQQNLALAHQECTTMPAARSSTDTIAVTRTFDGIESAAHRVISQVGGMDSVIKDAHVALLKPNFVAGRSAATGATTNLTLLKVVAEEVRACGAEPVLCEIPGTEFDTTAIYTILGVEQFCADNDIRIIRLDPEGDGTEWVTLHPPGARRLRHFRIPRFLQEARFINLPVLKTHVVSTMSLGMKNPMGILPRPDRRNMHTLGISQCIVDMNCGIRPDLTIVDGSIGQDGEGPVYGDKANLQVLVAGRNTLAVDVICCQLVGVNPRDVRHLKRALGYWGTPSRAVVGEDIKRIRQFHLPERKRLYRFIFWLMYPFDYPYSWIKKGGRHLCTALYGSGLVGTRPWISEDRCTRCGICIETCPLSGVIDLKTLKVDYAACQRCLLCYEGCPESAIDVKGYSGARGSS